MRIGVDWRFTSGSHMGTGVYAECMARALADESVDGDEIHLFAHEFPSPEPWMMKRVRYAKVPSAFSGAQNFLGERLVWDSRIEQASLDVYVASTGLAPLVRDCALVVTVHDLLFEREPRFFSPPLGRFLKREIRRAVHCADLILAVSEFTKRELIDLYDVKPSKIRVEPPRIRDCFKSRPTPATIQGTLKRLKIDSPYFLVLSNHAPHKNTEFAIEIFQRWIAVSGNKEILLVIAGGGLSPQVPVNLQGIVSARNLDGRVRVLGRVEDTELPALYAEARAFLFPSLYEGWGLPPLEALAMGTVPVTSNRGAMPEALREAGVILPLEEPQQWVHTLNQLSANGPGASLNAAIRQRRDALWSTPSRLRPYLNEALAIHKARSESNPKKPVTTDSTAIQTRRAGISVCTIVREAVRLGYPLEASIESYEAICDEIVILWDPTSRDGTQFLLNAIRERHPKVNLVESVWDMNNRKGGRELATQTQKAFDQCVYAMTLYVQADECIHEGDHPRIRELARDDSVAGVCFQRRSFLGNLDCEIAEHRVRGLLRLFRTGHGVSLGDAMQCQINGHSGSVIQTDLRMFNYSRLGHAAEVAARCKNLHRFYHDDAWVEDRQSQQDLDLHTIPFKESHPAPIERRFRSPSERKINVHASAHEGRQGFSIIIPSFNDLPYLKLLLESIARYSEWEHEIIVVTDGSEDGTNEFLKGNPKIKSQSQAKNLGICTTTNRAADLATREWLFLANSDMVVGPKWDRALYAHLNRRRVLSATCIEPGLVKVAPIFHTLDCGKDAEAFQWEKFEGAVARLAEDRLEEGVQYPFCVSRALWRQVGGLDTAFDPGPFSDPDLFYRLALAGAEFVRTRASLLYHFSGVALRRRDPERWKATEAKNFRVFIQKWGEPPGYVFGGTVNLGEAARSKKLKGSVRHLHESNNTVRIAAHVIARESDAFGALLLESCLGALREYADEIIVVDNGLTGEARDLVQSQSARLPLRLVDARNVDGFANLRNRAIEATSQGITHIHKVDTDEVYFPAELKLLKQTVAKGNGEAIKVNFVHFMIEPTLVDSIQEKEVLFPLSEQLRWEGNAHESIAHLAANNIRHVPITFLHFGYCRPQWQTFLKWLRYALLQSGSLAHYQFEFLDGVRVPYFRGTRTPNTVLEPRRGRLSLYKEPYPITVKGWLEEYKASGQRWMEWVEERSEVHIWQEWQRLYREFGAWEQTLDPILRYAQSSAQGLQQRVPETHNSRKA